MKTISISISDFEYNQFGLSTDKMQFTELLDIFGKEMAKQALNQSVRLAEKYNLSDMSMDEINKEVKAVRDAKNNNYH
ncbi:MAG: hypothetical protein JXB49_33200 [Bacteroidales bacterium]|nr:hypothetical protein [Bacteroidales bacterium]